MTNDLIDFPEGPSDEGLEKSPSKENLLSDVSGARTIQTPKPLTPYVDKLIQWPLVCQVDPQEVDFRCDSNEIKKCHIMTIPPKFLENLRYYLSGAVHELVHFNLSENLTPLFSVAKIARSMREKFTKAQKGEDQKSMEEMNEDLQLLTMAHGLLDVYVNDGVTQADRNLSREDLKIFRDSVAANALTPESFDFNFLASFALHIALVERDGFGNETLLENPQITHREWIQDAIDRTGQTALFHTGTDQFMWDLQNLFTFLISQPKLPKDKETALRLLEETFNGFFGLMNAPTRARIVAEKCAGVECHAWEHYRI